MALLLTPLGLLCCAVLRCAACAQAFAEVLANNEAWTAPMDDTYKLLGVDPDSITTLDSYLQVRAVQGHRRDRTGSKC